MTSLILTLIGPDRPGLVDSVANLVVEHDGNWVESRMSHLAGYFAGIVRLEVDQEQADVLIAKLEGLQDQGLSTVVCKDESAPESVEAPVIHMELVGNDRPGIVSEVSHVLAEQNVNLEDFQTECIEAPNSGSNLFRARASLRLPAELSVHELQQALEAIALDLMVDIQLASTDS